MRPGSSEASEASKVRSEHRRGAVSPTPRRRASRQVGEAYDGVDEDDHLRDLAVSSFTSRPEVAHIETSLIFEHISKPGLPDLDS